MFTNETSTTSKESDSTFARGFAYATLSNSAKLTSATLASEILISRKFAAFHYWLSKMNNGDSTMDPLVTKF